MLRITQSSTVPLTTLHLVGKLLKPWVPEVQRATTDALRDGAVQLNLRELTFADEAGIQLLLHLRAQGVQLSEVTPLIRGLLRRAGD